MILPNVVVPFPFVILGHNIRLLAFIQHWAIDKAHKSITRMLVEKGAALNKQDKFGHSGIYITSISLIESLSISLIPLFLL